LFPEEELLRLATMSPAAKREQLVREALAPYLSLADLRRLAAKGEDLQAALTGLQPLPEAVRALLTLLSLLLAPSHEESIRQPADIAALLRLGHLDHEAKKKEKHEMKRNERLILGIDPGFGRIGYAVLSAQGMDLHLVACDAIITSSTMAYPQRLQQVYAQLDALLPSISQQKRPSSRFSLGKT
jgi:hypothetical protein